jgi:5-methylcytosine-specific restriction enzyme A
MAGLKTLQPRLTARDNRVKTQKQMGGDPFYQTHEYKSWRAAVLRRAGFRCEDPDHPANLRRSGPQARCVADHIAPRRQGGDDFGPGICRCWTCHRRKTIRDQTALARRNF